MSCKAGDGCSTIASGFDLCDTESLHHVGALQTFLFACRPGRRASRHVPNASGRVAIICRSTKADQFALSIPRPPCPRSGPMGKIVMTDEAHGEHNKRFWADSDQ